MVLFRPPPTLSMAAINAESLQLESRFCLSSLIALRISARTELAVILGSDTFADSDLLPFPTDNDLDLDERSDFASLSSE